VAEVILYIDTNRTLEIVSELKKHGWVMGKDFDFACHKSKYDYHWQYEEEPNRSIFTFYNDVNASYFMLRWG
jgi:hypothetical protein